MILLTAILATTAMTAFSYVVSASFRKLYKEPLLLQYVLQKLHLSVSGITKSVLAWAIHYLIGLLFVYAFYLTVTGLRMAPSWLSGLIFGVIIGIVGIIGWEMMFKISGKPQITDRAGYYTQLFLAHLIFAFTTIAVYKLA